VQQLPWVRFRTEARRQGGNQRASLNVPNANPVPDGASPVVSHRRVEEVQVPFLMELKRPRKLRFELQFNGQTAVQVYDGVNGWKLKPFLNRSEVEPYTAAEMKQSNPLLNRISLQKRIHPISI